MLRVLDEYCRDWQFQPAYSKTKVLRFGACKQETEELYLPSMHHEAKPGEPPVVVDGGAGTDTNPVAAAEVYTYLGVVFQADRRFSKHANSVVAPAVRTAGFQPGYFNYFIKLQNVGRSGTGMCPSLWVAEWGEVVGPAIPGGKRWC